MTDSQVSDNIENDWESFKTTVHSAALQVLGPATRNHQDWFDENDSRIQALLEDKRQLLRAHQSDPTSAAKKAAYTSKRSTVQAELRTMQDAWLSNKAGEIQGYADRNDMKNFYSGLKEVYGPSSSGSFPLLSSDGTTLITEKRE